MGQRGFWGWPPLAFAAAFVLDSKYYFDYLGWLCMPDRRKSVMRKGIMFAALISLGWTSLAQTPAQVKVAVDNAIVRVKPEVNAEMLDIAAKGKTFDVSDKIGAWYKIVVARDQSGKPIFGYIHEATVKPIGEVPPKPKTAKEPEQAAAAGAEQPPAPPAPAAPLPREVPGAQPKVKSRDRVISGTSIKYGFNDHWLAALELNFGLGRNFGLGLELQPYYKKYENIDLTVLETNVFLNAKAGFRLAFLSFYGGGGVGPNLSYTSTEIEGESFSEFKTMLAYHLIVGTELDLKIAGLVFEYQAIVVSDPDIDPDQWSHFFLVGLRF
jgi:opacity protein-like surface antigen